MDNNARAIDNERIIDNARISENNGEFQKIVKELGFENGQELTAEDLTKVFEYMQETYFIES